MTRIVQSLARRSAAEHGLDLRFVWGVEGGSGEELNDGMVRHFLPEADARQYKEQHARYKAGNMTDKERADFLHGLKVSMIACELELAYHCNR